MGGGVVVEAGRRKEEEWVIAGSGMAVGVGGEAGAVVVGVEEGAGGHRDRWEKSCAPSSHVRDDGRQAGWEELGFQNDPAGWEGESHPTPNVERAVSVAFFPCPVALAGLVGPSQIGSQPRDPDPTGSCWPAAAIG